MEPNLQSLSQQLSTVINNQAEEQKELKKSDQQIDFISQFLELPANRSSLHHQRIQDFAEKKQQSVGNSQTIDRSESNRQNPFKQTKIKSIFHNFQKHLVVTLKTSIKLKTSHKKDPIINLAYRMWTVFIQSHLYCKKILHFLFGVSNLTPQQNYVQIRNYTIPGLGNLLDSHSIEQVRGAQQFLRNEVINKGYGLVQKNKLSYRRMQNNDQFQSYFISFLEQLQSGSLSRRLPKSQKLQIIKQIQKIKQKT